MVRNAFRNDGALSLAGQEGTQQSVVQFDEDRKPQPVAGEPVEVAARDSGYQAVDAQAGEVVAGLVHGAAPSSRPVIKARRLLLVMPVTASIVEHKAPARALTRRSPNCRPGGLSGHLVGRVARSAQGWTGKDEQPGRHVQDPSSRRRLIARAGLQLVEILGYEAARPGSAGRRGS